MAHLRGVEVGKIIRTTEDVIEHSYPVLHKRRNPVAKTTKTAILVAPTTPVVVTPIVITPIVIPIVSTTDSDLSPMTPNNAGDLQEQIDLARTDPDSMLVQTAAPAIDIPVISSKKLKKQKKLDDLVELTPPTEDPNES